MQKKTLVCWRKNKRSLFSLLFGHIVTLISYCNASLAQVNRALNGPDVSLFCRDTGLVWGWSIFFPVCFSTSFINQNIYVKKKALLKQLEVTIHVTSTSTFVGFALKNSAWKTTSLLVLFLKNGAQINNAKTITEWCFSCQNKSVCQKLAWSFHKKWKLTQKAIYTLSPWKPSIINSLKLII